MGISIKDLVEPIDPAVLIDSKATKLDISEVSGTAVLTFTATLGGSGQKVPFPIILTPETADQLLQWLADFLLRNPPTK